jgi:hypothetical protein
MPDNKLIIDDINEQEGVDWLTLNRPRIGNLKGFFTPPLARLRRRPLRARSAGGSPSTQRQPAAAARG